MPHLRHGNVTKNIHRLKTLFISLVDRSGSGKSTLVKHKLSQLGSRHAVYLLNVRPNEVEGYTKVHQNTVAIKGQNLADSLSQIPKNAYVIIEDIICVSHKEEESIRLLLNYRAHHDKLRVICIGHMLYRTHLLTLVPLFNYLVFTLVNASRGLLKTAATFGFHLDKSETSQWMETFSHHCGSSATVPGDYMFIDCSNVALHHSSSAEGVRTHKSRQGEGGRTVRVTAATATANGSNTLHSGRVTDLSHTHSNVDQKFASCFAGQSNSSTATAFFSIISHVLKGHPSFRAQDLSFKFEQARMPKRPKRISIIDYTCSLLCERPSAPPSTDLLVLHRFLCERAKIPALFIRNPYFWSTTSDASDNEVTDDDNNIGNDNDDNSSNVRKKKKVKR